MFSRPDLAVAAVRMVLHHALSGTETPFGNPMVAPSYLKEEAEELLELVLELHHENPAVSIPDLWALLTAKALARLGGPSVAARRGRDGPAEDAAVEDLLQFPPSLVPEDKRDVLNLKRVLSREGFSLEQIVALAGCNRNLGYHEAANFHTKEEVKPMLKRQPSMMGPSTDHFHAPDLLEKSTLDPYVFGGEYFDLLLDYNWKPGGMFKKGSHYRCSQKERRRQVTLLDPFSEKTLETRRRHLERLARSAAALEGAKEDSQGEEKTSGRFGRSGEAQFIPWAIKDKKEDPVSEEVDRALESSIEVDDPGDVLDPCEHVSMRGIDVMLLDDALTRGWLHHFSEDEISFFSTVSDVFAFIQGRGHNANKLYETHRIT